MTTWRQRWTSWWHHGSAEPQRLPPEVERWRTEVARLRAEVTRLNSQIVLLAAQRNIETARADALLAGAKRFHAELN